MKNIIKFVLSFTCAVVFTTTCPIQRTEIKSSMLDISLCQFSYAKTNEPSSFDCAKITTKDDELNCDIHKIRLQANALNQLLSDFINKERIDEIDKHRRIATSINVMDYGAKGDGIADDTIAINTCLQKNPSAQIFFPRGIYRVTNTIKAYAGVGSQTIFLSKIIYDGAVDADKPVFDISLVRTDLDENTHKYKGGAILVGGTIDCQQKGGIGIRHNGFTGRIIGVHILNFVSCGILLGDELNGTIQNNKSQQTLLSSCEITNFPRSNGIGIALVHSDNNVDNCNINGCDAGFLLRTGGHHISNTHVTNNTNIPSSTQDLSGCMIRVIPYKPSANEVSAFSNCYWNGCMKSVINVPRTNSLLSIHMVNCDTVIGAGKEVDSEAFLIDGGYKTPIHLNGCTFAHGRRCTFYGLYPWTGTEADYNIQISDVASNSPVKPYTLEISNQSLRYNMIASNLNGMKLQPGYARHIGYLVSYSNKFHPPISITWGQGSTFAEQIFLGMQVSARRTLYGNTNFQLLLDSKQETITFKNVGVSITCKKIYIYNNTSSQTSNTLWIKNDFITTMPTQIYLWHGNDIRDFIPNLENYVNIGGGIS